MTVTTQLIGKLGGGGGAPEMQNQQVASTSFVRIPSGWGKAVGVFAGTATAASPTVFGTVFKGMSAGSFLNGGGGHHPADLFRFSLRHDHVGAPGIDRTVVVTDGCHHTTRRETRRGLGLGAVGLRQFPGARANHAKSHVGKQGVFNRSDQNRRRFGERAGDGVFPVAQRRKRERVAGRANRRIPKGGIARRVVVA